MGDLTTPLASSGVLVEDSAATEDKYGGGFFQRGKESQIGFNFPLVFDCSRVVTCTTYAVLLVVVLTLLDVLILCSTREGS